MLVLQIKKTERCLVQVIFTSGLIVSRLSLYICPDACRRPAVAELHIGSVTFCRKRQDIQGLSQDQVQIGRAHATNSFPLKADIWCTHNCTTQFNRLKHRMDPTQFNRLKPEHEPKVVHFWSLVRDSSLISDVSCSFCGVE